MEFFVTKEVKVDSTAESKILAGILGKDYE